MIKSFLLWLLGAFIMSSMFVSGVLKPAFYPGFMESIIACLWTLFIIASYHESKEN